MDTVSIHVARRNAERKRRSLIAAGVPEWAIQVKRYIRPLQVTVAVRLPHDGTLTAYNWRIDGHDFVNYEPAHTAAAYREMSNEQGIGHDDGRNNGHVG